jgi:hypothetical protein
LPIDSRLPVWHHAAKMNASKKQSSFTRAASTNRRRVKKQFPGSYQFSLSRSRAV